LSVSPCRTNIKVVILHPVLALSMKTCRVLSATVYHAARRVSRLLPIPFTPCAFWERDNQGCVAGNDLIIAGRRGRRPLRVRIFIPKSRVNATKGEAKRLPYRILHYSFRRHQGAPCKKTKTPPCVRFDTVGVIFMSEISEWSRSRRLPTARSRRRRRPAARGCASTAGSSSSLPCRSRSSAARHRRCGGR